MKRKLFPICSVIALFFVSTASCTNSVVDNKDTFVELFSIPIGMSEHLLFYSDHPDAVPFNRSAIDMQGGIFTLVSGLANKINRYTSYGELIFSLYDQERSGATAIPHTTDPQRSLVSRSARTYPFNGVSDVTVNNQGVFYIVDHVPEVQIAYDEELESALRMQVVRYDSRNDLFSVIGQEGRGGTPFPYIHSLHVVSGNRLVVICDVDDAWLAFWYSSEGRLLYEVAFPPTAIPALETEVDAIEIEAIAPDPNQLRLYVKVNYYSQQAETISRLYWLGLPDGVYQDFVELPRYENRDNQQYQPAMNFLGITNQQQLVFYSLVSDGDFEVLVMDLDDDVLLRRTVALSEEQILFADFSLSSAGVISAFIGHEERTRVLWWRLDKELVY